MGVEGSYWKGSLYNVVSIRFAVVIIVLVENGRCSLGCVVIVIVVVRNNGVKQHALV